MTAQPSSVTAQHPPVTAQSPPATAQHNFSKPAQRFPPGSFDRPTAHNAPESSNARQHQGEDEILPMPNSWVKVIQCAVKDFQKATEILLRSQSLVEKLQALEQDNKVIQSLMVKIPGLVASDPDATGILKSGLESITARYRIERHTFYLHHEQSIVEKNEARVSQLASDFRSKLKQLASPFQHIQFNRSFGPVDGSVIAAHWTSLALSSYNRQVNEFKIQLVECRSARDAAHAARNAAREELAKHANDIPREEAIFVLVQREVAKSLQAQQ